MAINNPLGQVTINNSGGGDSSLNFPGLVAPQWPPGTPYSATSSFSFTAGRAYVNRIRAGRAFSIQSLAIMVNVLATSNDSIDIGVYDTGFNLLAHTGLTASKINTGTPPFIASISLGSTLTLSANTTYYAALVCAAVGGTAAQVFASTASTTALFGQTFGATSPNFTAGFGSTGGAALPNTLTVSNFAGQNSPFIFLREF